MSPERQANGRFSPGRSGDPSGRPKTARRLTENLTRWLEEETGDGWTRAQILMRKLYDLAVAGDGAALKIIYDRREGRAPQKVDVDATVRGDAAADLDAILRSLGYARIPADRLGADDMTGPMPPARRIGGISANVGGADDLRQ
jgi:hypothetical protein